MGITDSTKIRSEDAHALYKECMNDMKARLVNKANLIQERFDMETKELERRQARYQVKQVHITKEEEEEYVNYRQSRPILKCLILLKSSSLKYTVFIALMRPSESTS